jgi:hypothetical protein
LFFSLLSVCVFSHDLYVKRKKRFIEIFIIIIFSCVHDLCVCVSIGLCSRWIKDTKENQDEVDFCYV